MYIIIYYFNSPNNVNNDNSYKTNKNMYRHLSSKLYYNQYLEKIDFSENKCFFRDSVFVKNITIMCSRGRRVAGNVAWQIRSDGAQPSPG